MTKVTEGPSDLRRKRERETHTLRDERGRRGRGVLWRRESILIISTMEMYCTLFHYSFIGRYLFFPFFLFDITNKVVMNILVCAS